MLTSIWFAIVLTAQVDQADLNMRDSQAMPIIGRVTAAQPLELALLRVKVISQSGHRTIVDTPLGMQGTFQIPALPMGFYEIRIVGQNDDIRYTQDFHSGTTTSFHIHLASQFPKADLNSISAARLLHKTNKKAAREMNEASKALGKGNREKAIEHLEKSIVEDPDNFDAYSSIGALYLQQKDLLRAGTNLEKAYAIDPNDPFNNVNLAAFHVNTGNFAKAEQLANSSLKADPNSVRGRYVLAYALIQQGKDVESARVHLNNIQKVFTPARNLLNALNPIVPK